MIAYYPVCKWLVVVGCLLMVACSSPSHPQTHLNQELFAFEEEGRWGYLDSTGAVVLRPHYRAAGSFNEGVAPVRIDGLYKYIDQQEHDVLPPAYAYATPFRAGLAVVWPDSTPQLIDHAGHQVLLAATYQQLEWHPGLAHSGVWVGTLASGKRHVLAANGKLLSQTAFERVEALSNNRIVVEDTEPLRNAAGQLLTEAVGVLDGRGRLVIPYYRFSSISTFRGGLATASLYQPGDAPEPQCIIDTTGRVLARLPHNQEFADYSEAEFADGVVRVHISKNGGEADLDNSYPAVIDQRGRVLFHNRRLQRLTDFYHGRAWAREKDDDWYLIDKTGHRLSTVAVQRLLRPGSYDAAPAFANGAEVVMLANNAGYAALDSTGQVLHQLAKLSFIANPGDQAGDLLLLYAADSTRHLGFWNWRTGQVVPPRFSAINYAGYRHRLLAVLENDRLGYLSPTGRYVWRAAPAVSTPLNLDAMRCGVYTVASAPLPHRTGYDGWGSSSNTSHPIGSRNFRAGVLSLQVAPAAVPDAGGPHTHGHALTIANTMADTVVFNAQDSMLDLVVQARDPAGRWRNIEYLPSSFCGNSYHTVFLAPGRYWQLAVPAYTGSQPTHLRAKLVSREPANGHAPRTWYSNEFMGSVNPAQFWNRPSFVFSDNIMNPYLD